MGADDLIFRDEVYGIVGAAMDVHSEMGPGFLEAVYQECLAIELDIRGIPFVQCPRMALEYKGRRLKKEYVPDFLAHGEIIIEIKAISACGPNEEAQVINALRAGSKRLGVLINFGEKSLHWKRYVETRG